MDPFREQTTFIPSQGDKTPFIYSKPILKTFVFVVYFMLSNGAELNVIVKQT